MEGGLISLMSLFMLFSTTFSLGSFYFRTIFFHPDGLCLYSGAVDMMKVYSWEPFQCHDSVALGWSKVADVAIAQNQLVSVKVVQIISKKQIGK